MSATDAYFTIAYKTSDVLPWTNQHNGSGMCGESGITVVVEVSTNLTDWIPIFTNVLGSEPLPWSDPEGTQFQQRFYRLFKP